MATHSNILAWRIPGTEEPGGLPSMGSHRVRPDWSNLAAAAAILFFNKMCPLKIRKFKLSRTHYKSNFLFSPLIYKY